MSKSWWAAVGVAAFDAADEVEFALAVWTAEGRSFRELGERFNHFSKVGPDSDSRLFSRATQEPVMPEVTTSYDFF